jgi:hypothetical protein
MIRRGFAIDRPDALQVPRLDDPFARSQRAKEIKILVLRHQLAVLQRGTPRPSELGSRALMATLTQLLPSRPRLGLLVAPATSPPPELSYSYLHYTIEACADD